MKGNRMDIIKRYWWMIIFVFGLGGWVFMVESSIADAAENNKSQDKVIQKLADVVTNQQRLSEQINGKIDVILQLLGVKVTDSLSHVWKKMPRELPFDSLGHHLNNIEWLSISDDYLYARTFKWVNDDSILVKVEWDKRKRIE